MNRSIRFALLVFAAALLAACAPARTGVLNDTLTMNTKPGIGIKAAAPFTLADSGRTWALAETDSLTDSPLTSFDYAVYADPARPEAMAYAAIVALTDSENWNFIPQPAKLPHAFGGVNVIRDGGLTGSAQTLCVPAQNDWGSDYLRAQGKSIPAEWLARRWVYDLGEGIRAIAEYREPKPDWLQTKDRDILLVGESDSTYLREFLKRANAVFSATPGQGGDIGETKIVDRPLPNVARLAGEIVRTDRGGNDSDWD